MGLFRQVGSIFPVKLNSRFNRLKIVPAALAGLQMLLYCLAPFGLQIFTEAITNMMHHFMTGYFICLVHLNSKPLLIHFLKKHAPGEGGI
jgi:uncharacterized membrane protein YccF (DUF307 family)